MNDGRKNCSWTLDEPREQSETLGTTQGKIKTNKLKRSPKSNQTQKSVISNSTEEADFKTPTRVSRLGFRNSNTDESPNNDFELQHEIIWDSTSPATPVRNGRGRRRTAAFRSVDISDIVNRIAPKNMKAEDGDSTLLQWIGDTAVPCTPEIRAPRTKTKPARQNPVDDLLRLAKQFDFNMFQQEEAHLRTNPQSSAEAMKDQDQNLFFNDPAERPPLGIKDTKTNSDDAPDNLGLIQETQDALDLLFDDSTQQLSGNLSQGFSTCSPAVVIPPQSGTKSDTVKNACGVTRIGGASGLSTTSVHGVAPTPSTIKQVGNADDFDDDWNDNLMEDSLVIEMTQNPELFAAPQNSSTQKRTDTNARNGSKKANSERAQCFNQRPESVQPSQYWNKATGLNSKTNKETQAFPPCKVPLTVPGFHSVSKSNTQPKKLAQNRQHLATTIANTRWSSSFSARLDTSRFVSSDTPETTSVTRINSVTKEIENDSAVGDGVLCDLVADDLDSIFASDDIWEDGADDDDLFCEACEKVEESMAEPEPLSKASVLKLIPQRSTQKTSKHESGFSQSSKSNTQIYNHCAPGNQTPSNTHFIPNNNNIILALDNSKMSSKKIYGISTTGTARAAYDTARQFSESTTANTGQSYQKNYRDYYQFKKPNGTCNVAPSVSKDMSKAVGSRCSDAEIEKKKQQAMERRRLRMLASQNL